MARLRNQKARVKKRVALVNATTAKAFEKIKKLTYKELIEVGFDIEAEAKKNTPVDTGNLRAGIYTVSDGSNPEANGLKDEEQKQYFDNDVSRSKTTLKTIGKKKGVIVGASANYAKYVNGTPGRGFLFFTKAVHRQKNKMLKRMAKAGRIK